MKKILIISDTHGDMDLFVKLISLEKPDYTIHAGDFCIPVTYLSRYVDYFVAGNNDSEGEHMKLFEIEEVKFFLTHGDKYFFNKNKNICKDAKLYGANIAITGHTHVEEIVEMDDITLINPGSLIKPRNYKKIKTYCLLFIDKDQIVSKEIKEFSI